MKVIFFTLTISVLFASMQAKMTGEELVNLAEKCNGTQVEMEMLASFEIPSTESGKCLLTCMWQFWKVLDQQGNFHKEGCRKFYLKKWNEFEQHASTITDNCDVKLKEVKSNDPCEYGHKLTLCAVEKMKEYKFFEAYKHESVPLIEKLKNGKFTPSPEVYNKLVQERATL